MKKIYILLQQILQNIWESQAFQKLKRKVLLIEMKGIIISVKVDEINTILKSQLATGHWSRCEM